MILFFKVFFKSDIISMQVGGLTKHSPKGKQDPIFQH
jgi:hypothetical protein